MRAPPPQPSLAAWAVLRWLVDRRWATTAQILDRFWTFAGAAPRTGFVTLQRLQGQGLLQVHALDEAQGRRTQHVWGLTTKAFRLLGVDGVEGSVFLPGPAAYLVLQTTEVYVEREAEGWEVIPAGRRWDQYEALKAAQDAAVRRGDVKQWQVKRSWEEPEREVRGLPWLDLLFHRARVEARWVVVLRSANARGILPAGGERKIPGDPNGRMEQLPDVWVAIRPFRPVTFEIVTIGSFPRREEQMRRWANWQFRHVPLRVSFEQVRSYRTRRSPAAGDTATGRNVYEELGVPDPRFK